MDENTLRAYFAMGALQGLVQRMDERRAAAIASAAFDIADAMVAERERRYPPRRSMDEILEMGRARK